MKCRGCGEEKPDEAFALRSDKGYRRRTCNDCMNQHQRQRQAKYRADRRAWKERTKWEAKGGRAAARGDWLRNMAPAAKTRYIRDANLKALYGIRLKEYAQLLEQQAGLCAICGRPPRSRRVLDVDMITLRESCAACFVEIATGPSGSWMTTLSYSTGPRPIFSDFANNYLTKLMILKRGKYSAITMPPTAAPMTAMRMGSIMLVKEATAASTSWS